MWTTRDFSAVAHHPPRGLADVHPTGLSFFNKHGKKILIGFTEIAKNSISHISISESYDQR